jgi:putative membrane protein (TIGR04086 family)
MTFLKNIIKSYLFFIIIMLFSSILYTSIIYFGNISLSNSLVNVISIIINIFVFFIFGIFIGKLYKEKGLMNAFIVSLILMFIIICLKLITKSFTPNYLIKALCCIFSASIGGIIGVNKTKQ